MNHSGHYREIIIGDYVDITIDNLTSRYYILNINRDILIAKQTNILEILCLIYINNIWQIKSVTTYHEITFLNSAINYQYFNKSNYSTRLDLKSLNIKGEFLRELPNGCLIILENKTLKLIEPKLWQILTQCDMEHTITEVFYFEGKLRLISNNTTEIAIVNLQTFQLEASICLPDFPSKIIQLQDGKLLYVYADNILKTLDNIHIETLGTIGDQSKIVDKLLLTIDNEIMTIEEINDIKYLIRINLTTGNIHRILIPNLYHIISILQDNKLLLIKKSQDTYSFVIYDIIIEEEEYVFPQNMLQEVTNNILQLNSGNLLNITTVGSVNNKNFSFDMNNRIIKELPTVNNILSMYELKDGRLICNSLAGLLLVNL